MISFFLLKTETYNLDIKYSMGLIDGNISFSLKIEIVVFNRKLIK